MAGLDFIIRGDNSDFLNKLKEIQNGVRSTAYKIEQSGMTIEDMFSRLTKAAAAFGAGFSATEFVKQIVRVRGEFQQLEVAFTTMLGGSQEAANDLMQQIVKLAATTPFDLQGVAGGARQLLAFGEDVNKITDDLTRLGNISAGLSQPIGDLVYLYGTTMTQGRLYAQDLYQFTGRGIPMVRELAKQMGVAEDEVKNLVTEGKIGFPEVQKVIQSLTNEGGMFYNLMQEQSKTITGQISNIEDSFSMMLNDIGKSSEGIINDALSGVSFLIDNYEKIGKVLLTVVSAYGAYKAALITIAALQKAQAIYGSVTAFISLAKSIRSTGDAMALFNLVTEANPIGLVVGAVAAAAAAFGLFSSNVNSASNMSTKFGEQASATISKVNTLTDEVNGLTKETSLRGKVMDELNGILEEYGVQAINESDSIDDVNEKRREAIELIKQEAIERDRLNNIDAGDQEYQQRLQDAQNELLNALKEARSGNSGIVSFVSDNKELQENAAAISTIIGNVIQENITKIAGKTGDEYEKGLNEIFETIQDRMRAIGISEKTISEAWVGGGLFSQSNIVQDYISKVQEASEGHDRYTESVNKAADAEKKAADKTSTYSQRVAMLEKSLQKPNEGVHQLYQNIKNLMSQYSNNTIGFTIRIGGEIPQWMNSKSIPELQRLAKQFSAIGATSKNGAFVNGKYMTQQQLLQRGADYATAADSKQTEADRKKQEQENKKTESDTKKKNDNALKEQQRAAEQRKKAQEELNRDLISLQQKNQDDEIALMPEGTEKKLAEIDNDYKKRIAEIDKQEAEFKKENKEAGAKGLTGGLTGEQQDELKKARDNAAKEQEKRTTEARKEELDSMREYLKQWGSLEQKRLAITEQYERKISEARNEGERKSLEKERDKALSSMNFEDISMGIDWSGLLSGVANLSKDTLEPMLRQLETYTRTDEYAKADMDERQKVVELIQELRQYVGTDQSATWQELAKAIEAFNEAVYSYQQAAGDEKQAVERLTEAKGKVERGEMTQADYDRLKAAADKLGERTVEAKDEMQSLANSVNELSDQVANQVSPLSTSLNNAKGWKGVHGFDQLQGSSSSIDQLKGTIETILPGMQDGLGKTVGTAMSDGIGKLTSTLGNGLSSVMSSGVGSIVGVVAQIPSMILQLADSIKNFVTGILDSISELLSLDWISDLVNSILGAIGNLIDTILDLPENLFHVLESIVVDGIGGLLNSVVGRLGNILSFGALSSGGPAEWFAGSNAEEVAKTIERLTERNKLLQQSIEDLTSTIEGGEGTRSVTAYEEAVRMQEEMEQNLLEMAKAQAGYVGSHHSWNAYWGGFTQEEIAELSRRIGRDWNGDLFDLSSSEMKELRGMVDTWARIQNTGKGGYGGRLTEKLDDYIEQAGQLEELTDQLNESLTQVSFDSLYDSFIDTLMDMDASAEDFANDFSEYMMRALLSNQVGEAMKDNLESWYEKWSGYMKDNELSDEELNDLRGEWQDMVNEGLSLRDRLAESIGYTGDSSSSSQQSASSKGYATATQDSIDELNGRFAAVYEVGLRIDDSNKNIRDSIINTVTGINSLVSLTTDGNAELRNILNQQVIANSHLEDIVKYTKPISELGVKLDKIVSKVNNL